MEPPSFACSWLTQGFACNPKPLSARAPLSHLFPDRDPALELQRLFALPEPARSAEKCHEFLLRWQGFEDRLKLDRCPYFCFLAGNGWETAVANYGEVLRQKAVRRNSDIWDQMYLGGTLLWGTHPLFVRSLP